MLVACHLHTIDTEAGGLHWMEASQTILNLSAGFKLLSENKMDRN